jgi:hypothetical protein
MEFLAVPRLFRVNNPRYSPATVDVNAYSPGTSAREDIIFTVAGMNRQNAIRKAIPEIIEAIESIFTVRRGLALLNQATD